jgi:TatD DNase family protein
MLEENPAAGIGECGLDGWVKSPAMPVQTAVFLDHLRVQRETRRPLTIHCLKAWGPLFDAFAAVPPRPGFLMHSFGGSWETARRLVAMGAWFSFSGHFLHPRKVAVVGVFRKLPKDRILLETDAPDMRPPDDFITHPAGSGVNHPANLPRIAEGLAAALDMDARELMPLIADNARRFLDGGS